MTHRNDKYSFSEIGYRKYGEKCAKAGDRVQVILNLDANSLSYIINGTDYGKAVDIKPNKRGYKLAVSFMNDIVLQLCD